MAGFGDEIWRLAARSRRDGCVHFEEVDRGRRRPWVRSELQEALDRGAAAVALVEGSREAREVRALVDVQGRDRRDACRRDGRERGGLVLG